MGPRIREDTEGGAGIDVLCMGGRLAGRGILGNGMLSVRGREGRRDSSAPLRNNMWFEGEGWDGSPHPRGQREGMDSRLRLHGGSVSTGGWGRGWVPASARTTGRGWIPAFVFTGAVSPPGDGSPHPRGHGEGDGATARFYPNPGGSSSRCWVGLLAPSVPGRA